jgi:iron(III) transport system ATP-binding protein
MAALETVQLAHLAERPAPRLSGGQQQRVAIARAMVGRPQVLLFDEPLSNLDARLRVEMRSELRRIQRQIGLSSIYVTHDQAEALAVSDWIVVMKEGRIVERGRPLDIYRYPRHVFTAQFLGSTNLVAGTVADVDAVNGRLGVTTLLGRVVSIDPSRTLATGAKVRVSIRPEDLSTQAPQDTGAVPFNAFAGTLTFAIFAGVAVEAELRCGEVKLQCLLNREADLTPGRAITVYAKADACLVLPEE